MKLGTTQLFHLERLNPVSLCQQTQSLGLITQYTINRAGLAQSVDRRLSCHMLWGSSMLDPGLEPYQCLYASMWIQTALLPYL